MGQDIPEGTRQTTEGYFHLSRSPLYALLFVVPMVIIYEVGVLTLTRRNLAQSLLERALVRLGFGWQFATGALVIAALVVWQLACRRKTRLEPGCLAAMLAESLLYAAVVLAFAAVFFARVTLKAGTSAVSGTFGDLVLDVGAGLYEEFLFRFILAGGIAFATMKVLRLESVPARIVAVVASSAAFAAYHCLDPWQDWNMLTFGFRFLAGMIFAGIFFVRGFGIAAGTHAIYDILVFAYSL